MRKEKIVPMIFLIMVLAVVLTLPQGSATKNFGNKPSIPPPRPSPTSPIAPHQSGNGLLVLSNSLPSNHLEGLEFKDGSVNVAFTTPLVNT